MPFPRRCHFLYSLVFPLALLVACNSSNQPPQSTTSATVEPETIINQAAAIPASEITDSTYAFEAPVRIDAAGEPIAVEEPGFACPTIYDFDADGKDDLIVGQFNSGKMKWYRNMADAGQMAEYAAGEWIHCGDEPAEVPGVS